MKTVAEFSYDAVIEALEYDVIAEITMGDYQGDHVYLLRNGDKFALAVLGFGSCSYCDTMQEIDGDLQALADYAKRTNDTLSWRSADEMSKYLSSDGNIQEWWFSDPGWQKFMTECERAVKTEQQG